MHAVKCQFNSPQLHSPAECWNILHIYQNVMGCSNGTKTLNTWSIKFCTVAPNIFSIITAVVFTVHTTHTLNRKQQTTVWFTVHWSVQNCQSSLWNSLPVTLLEPRIWGCFLHFLENMWTPGCNILWGNTVCDKLSLGMEDCDSFINMCAQRSVRDQAIQILYWNTSVTALCLEHGHKRSPMKTMCLCPDRPYSMNQAITRQFQFHPYTAQWNYLIASWQ
jgi:hypothetical protein